MTFFITKMDIYTVG